MQRGFKFLADYLTIKSVAMPWHQILPAHFCKLGILKISIAVFPASPMSFMTFICNVWPSNLLGCTLPIP